MKKTIYTIGWLIGISFVMNSLLFWSCTSNNDEGIVSADFMRVTDVVMSGNHTSTTLHIEADCSWKITEDVS